MSHADLFVYVASAAAWLVVAAWVYRIGRKANRLRENMDAAGRMAASDSDASRT